MKPFDFSSTANKYRFCLDVYKQLSHIKMKYKNYVIVTTIILISLCLNETIAHDVIETVQKDQNENSVILRDGEILDTNDPKVQEEDSISLTGHENFRSSDGLKNNKSTLKDGDNDNFEHGFIEKSKENSDLTRYKKELNKKAKRNPRVLCPSDRENWYNRQFLESDRTTLTERFKKQHYTPPRNSYALIAPIHVQNGIPCLEYYSYGDTAFEFSMTREGEEKFWPASAVKLMAAVLALVKLREYNLSSQASVQFNDIEGHYEGTVKALCREAIIPSSNTAYNRLMEIAGFDQANDDYLPNKFHFPTMILQRRYARHHPDDNIRLSPAILYREDGQEGLIPLRTSTGRKRHFCPREGNCMTLAELAEVMMRVVLHHELPSEYRFPVLDSDADMLIEALKEAPSCIDDGVYSTLGEKAVIYNKGGKVIGDDRLEVAVVSSRDGSERYLIGLSVPYYDGVEKATNELAKQLIVAVKALENHL